jgi:hypothetical protein
MHQQWTIVQAAPDDENNRHRPDDHRDQSVGAGPLKQAHSEKPRRVQGRKNLQDDQSIAPSSSFEPGGGSVVLQIGHGAPAAPQPHASSPSHGLSGWAWQTHMQPSQRQQIIRACGMATPNAEIARYADRGGDPYRK